MEIEWQALWRPRRKWLKMGSLIAAVLLAVYGGVIRPSRALRGIANQKASGLAAIERNRHWLVPLSQSVDNATLAGGMGGVPGEFASRSVPMTTYLTRSGGVADRKLVRTSSIDLLVKRPAESAEKVRSLTKQVGGFLVKSQTNGGAQRLGNGSRFMRLPEFFAQIDDANFS